ncbi:MAG: hypothetical protein ACTHXU_12665 [Halomonas sp.]|uniref:hypothetical protein n=1 Tax=Halomonas casei TaxID=2742613 RepID=UPI003CE7A034
MSQKTYIFEGRLVAEQPLATCSKDLLDREGKKNQPTPIPTTQTAMGERLLFPASGLRGGLRRACRDVVRECVINSTGNDKPFDLDTHFMLSLGGIKGAGEEDKASVTRIADLRKQNPLINLFGAGDAGTAGFVSGRLGIGNAICEEPLEPVIFSGARLDDIYRDPDQADFLSNADLIRLTDMASGNRELSRLKAEATKLKRSFYEARESGNAESVQAITDQLDTLETKMAGIREESGSKNSIGMPLAGWKAIPQGATMTQRTIMRRATDVDLGLFLATLNRFGLEPILGAHYANGNGLVSGEWTVYEVTTAGKKEIGRVEMLPFDTTTVTGEPLLAAQKAFDAFIDQGDWNFNQPEKV